MKKIVDKKILISEYSKKLIYGVVVLSLLLVSLFSLKIETSLLLTFEQTIFVIISAILFVFNESIIGYATISKIRNKINTFKKVHIKNEVLSYIGNQAALKQYDDFLNEVEVDIVSFSKSIEIFKRKTYKLYMIFSIFGFLAIALTLVKSNSFIICYLVEHNFTTFTFLKQIQSLSIMFFIFGQLLSIPIWIISAYQTQMQKQEMIEYFDIQNISKKLVSYIDEKLEKSIDLQMN